MLGGEPATKFYQIWPPSGCRSLSFHFCLTRGRILVYFRGVFQVKRNNFMDKSQCKRGKYFAQLLRGTALIIKICHVLQADTMTGKMDVTIGILNKEIR
jgi:hypothetical protein